MRDKIKQLAKRFTFQYVSIKTANNQITVDDMTYLHSNMFLLRLKPELAEKAGHHSFTFQYVSIKTLSRFDRGYGSCQIYIPICFY